MPITYRSASRFSSSFMTVVPLLRLPDVFGTRHREQDRNKDRSDAVGDIAPFVLVVFSIGDHEGF